MSAEIRYVRSADGTTIAYSVSGQGPPLLYIRPGTGQLDRDKEIPTIRRQLEWLEQRFTVIRSEPRGGGLSQRGDVALSLERFVEDCSAVLDRVDVERFAILSGGPASMLAFALAHRWPTRVIRLLLTTAITSGKDLQELPGAAVLALAATDYEIFTEALASTIYGWSSEEARAAARIHRESRTQTEDAAVARALWSWDVTALLPEIEVPTLIWQPRDGFLSSMTVARRIVAALPNARLLVRSGNVVVVDYESESTLAEVERFLSWAAPEVAAEPPHGTLVLLFADIVDSTGLTERLGDGAFHARTRDLDGKLREAIRRHGGRPVEGKLLGDGVLATFASAHEAIAAGLDCAGFGNAANLPMHVGIHAGDVIREGGDVHGGAVNVAARISDVSSPGEVLVSEVVRALARTSAGVVFDDRGEHALRGIGESLRLFAVRPKE